MPPKGVQVSTDHCAGVTGTVYSWLPHCPNLIRSLILTGLDQIWVADITYVRLAEAFVYLAVILDAFSRRVLGWALDDRLRAELALSALDMALRNLGDSACDSGVDLWDRI